MARKNIRWTEELLETVRTLYPKMGPTKLAEQLGINPQTLMSRASVMGITNTITKSIASVKRKEPSCRKPKWTQEQLDILRARYPSEGDAALVEAIGKNADVIRHKASRMRITRNASVNEDYFETWTPNMAYTLGYIYADGNISKDLYALTFACHAKDEEMLLAIRDDMESTQTVYRRPANQKHGRNNGPQVGFVVGSKKVVKCLCDKHGLRPGKTWLDLPFPEVPEEFLPHFVRGYFDGDGCAHHSTKEKSICLSMVCTESFARGMQRRIIGATDVKENKLTVQGKQWTMAWGSRADVRKLVEWLYPAGDYIFLARKKEKASIIFSLPEIPWTRRKTCNS